MENIEPDFSKINIEDQPQTLEKPQQSFSFDTDTSSQTEQVTAKTKYKLPDINYLEKNLSKLSSNGNKNRPDAEFMEKILLDFGIDGKIKTINNGPVVSLYEFEPAPGVKVSKIINLSEDLARNTSSTSTRVSVIPGKTLLELKFQTRKEKVYH